MAIPCSLFYVNIYTANGINNARESMGIYNYVMVNAYIKKVFYGTLTELVTAVSIGMINLFITVTFYFYSGISRY